MNNPELKNKIKFLVSKGFNRKNLCGKIKSGQYVSDYCKSISPEELFRIAPPLKLSTKGTVVGKYSPLCEQCGSNCSLISYTAGYYKFCSVRCSSVYNMRLESHTDKQNRVSAIKTTIGLKYGCGIGSILQIRLGKFYNPFSHPEVRKKIYATNMKLYGNPYGHNTEGIARGKRNLKLYREKHPYEYSIQQYKSKPLHVNGKLFVVQGYEGQTIQYLAKNGVNVHDIHQYPFTVNYTFNNKSRLYIPDMLAKIRNKWWVLEVKSDYTAGISNIKYKTYFYNTQRKSEAVYNEGYRIATIIHCAKRNVFKLYNNIHSQQRRDVIEHFYE